MTPWTNAHVTAASIALPPRRMTSRPISAATGCGHTIIATGAEKIKALQEALVRPGFKIAFLNNPWR